MTMCLPGPLQAWGRADPREPALRRAAAEVPRREVWPGQEPSQDPGQEPGQDPGQVLAEGPRLGLGPGVPRGHARGGGGQLQQRHRGRGQGSHLRQVNSVTF